MVVPLPGEEMIPRASANQCSSLRDSGQAKTKCLRSHRFDVEAAIISSVVSTNHLRTRPALERRQHEQETGLGCR